MPQMPTHIQQIADKVGYTVPQVKTSLNNKQLMAEYAAAVKDGRISKRALKQAVKFYNQTRKTYGPKTKSKARKN